LPSLLNSSLDLRRAAETRSRGVGLAFPDAASPEDLVLAVLRRLPLSVPPSTDEASLGSGAPRLLPERVEVGIDSWGCNNVLTA